MTTISTSLTQHNEFEHALALVHIGMMLAEYSADETLPRTTNEATERIHEIFGINMWEEPDVYTVRNKMTAIIEHLNIEKDHS